MIQRLDKAEERCDLILSANVSVNRVTRLANYLRTESYTVMDITELSETATQIKELESVEDVK